MLRDDDPLVDARGRVVFPVAMDPFGLAGPTRGQTQGPNWRRSSRGLFVPASVDASDVEQRIAEAAAVLPEVGGVTGWAGLRWAGAIWFDGSTPQAHDGYDVDLATCYQDIRNQPGHRVCQERLGPAELETRDGVRMTLAVRSLLFAMRYAQDLGAAVKCVDMAAYSDICSIQEVSAYALAHPGWTGIPQARAAVLLADENSWSPKETDLRLLWEVEAGLPHPLTNRPVFDLRGRHIGTPDLLDLESGVVAEYDGALHLEGARRASDTRRSEEFRNHGLEPLHVVGHDLADHEQVIRRMLDARRRAKWEAQSQRSWTIEPPPWWRETHTVDLRLALDADVRKRLLAHRRRAS